MPWRCSLGGARSIKRQPKVRSGEPSSVIWHLLWANAGGKADHEKAVLAVKALLRKEKDDKQLLEGKRLRRRGVRVDFGWTALKRFSLSRGTAAKKQPHSGYADARSERQGQRGLNVRTGPISTRRPPRCRP
ncbi:MAG: hypothetical protein BJ554DRAFT_7263 [Olpidium bornovanus]|uniref:Uncharacterized protein n=1 Tax=Olpidium bornovanus TaxID=278681 RepID=A0A8H8DK00_9FUNG|nr:MAG: hypothetical protein BJ554DRAFT_7263 [Olpidium bornovanus]